MRSTWDGSITIGGLFNVPVKLYKATEDGNGVSFRQLCHCGTPIRQPKWCDKCQKEVPFGELLKGYPITKDTFVKLTAQEVDALKPENFKRVDILTFKPLSELLANLVQVGEHYYSAPGKGGDAGYVLLRELVNLTGKVPIGKIIFRDREHLCMVTTYKKRLVIHTLHFPDEVRNPDELKEPMEIAIGDRQLELGKMLVEQLAENGVKIEDIKEDYAEKVHQLVLDRMKGKPMPEVQEIQPATGDLAQTLELTLDLLKTKSPRIEALKQKA